MSHSAMPFTWKNSSLKIMSELEVERIEEKIVANPCPWSETWFDFLTGDTPLDDVMRNRARYCVDQAPCGTHGLKRWYRGADQGLMPPYLLITNDEPMRPIHYVPPEPVHDPEDDREYSIHMPTYEQLTCAPW